jgi:hypothetical protein
MDDLYVIDEKNEMSCSVVFSKEMHIVTDLKGEIVSTDEADWVEIRMPGDPDNIIKTLANDEHRARFPRAWSEYKGMADSAGKGIPLEEWDIHPNMVKVLKELGFTTIDHVANASEHSLLRVQGGYGWKIKAMKWLEDKRPKESDLIAAQQAEINELKAMVGQLMQKKAS